MKTIIIESCETCLFMKTIRSKKRKCITYVCTMAGGKPINSLWSISDFCPIPNLCRVHRAVLYGNGKKRIGYLDFEKIEEAGK